MKLLTQHSKRSSVASVLSAASSFQFALNSAKKLLVTWNDEALGKAISSDEWIQISPYGVFQSYDRKFWQVVNEHAAETMVNQFNSLASKVGDLFRGVPIYAGHPDYVKEDTDKRRYGKIVELRAGDDGLYGRVKWNDLGRQNLEEGYFVYPSAGWGCDDRPGKGARMGDGRMGYEPAYLGHVGLTNTPNIPGVEPVTPNSESTQHDMIKLPKTHGALGLDPEKDADDDTLLGAISKVKDAAKHHETVNSKLMASCNEHIGHLGNLHAGINAALKHAKMTVNDGNPVGYVSGHTSSGGDIVQLPNNNVLVNSMTTAVHTLGTRYMEMYEELEKAQQLVITVNTARAKERIDLAINAGVLTEADRAGWTPKLMDNFSGAAKELDDKSVTINAGQSIIGLVAAARGGLQTQTHGIQDVAEARGKIESWVKQYMEDKKLQGGDGFRQAWNASKTDPEMKAAHDRLGKPVAA